MNVFNRITIQFIVLSILLFRIQCLIQIPLSGLPGQGYYFSAYLGTPVQKVFLLIDTGSANLAVASLPTLGAQSYFNEHSSSSLTYLHKRISLNYLQGSWTGKLVKDILDFSEYKSTSKLYPHLVRVEVALIDQSIEFFLDDQGKTNWNGIAGLSFSNIAVQPHSSDGFSYAWINYLIPSMLTWYRPDVGRPSTHSFLDDLSVKFGLDDSFSVSLCGSTNTLREGKVGLIDGEFIIGGYKEELKGSKDNFVFTPVRFAWYFEVILTNFRVDGEQVITDCKELNFDKTIVDTGTTNIRLPQRVFDSFLSKVKDYSKKKDEKNFNLISERFWESKSALCQSSSDPIGGQSGAPYTLFPNLEWDMVIDGDKENSTIIRLDLSPQQYIRYVGRVNSGGSKKDCFVFGVQRNTLGTVIGSVFLEGFYTIFDRTGMKVGFANSKCSIYTTANNMKQSKVIGEKSWSIPNIPEASKYPLVPPTIHPRDCAFFRLDVNQLTREIFGINLWLATFVVVMIMLISCMTVLTFMTIKLLIKLTR